MAIKKEDVKHVASLARLKPTEDEIELYTRQLQRVLAHVEKISVLDTENVEPTSFTVPFRRVFREDRVTGSIDHKDALGNAPETHAGCFKVPKVIE